MASGPSTAGPIPTHLDEVPRNGWCAPVSSAGKPHDSSSVRLYRA